MHVSSGDTGVTWLVNGVVGAESAVASEAPYGTEGAFNGEAPSMCKLAFAFVWACLMKDIYNYN